MKRWRRLNDVVKPGKGALYGRIGDVRVAVREGVGASKRHHLDDAIAAFDVTLTADELASLEALYVLHDVVGFQLPSRTYQSARVLKNFTVAF